MTFQTVKREFDSEGAAQRWVKVAGVSHDTIAKVEKLEAEAMPEVKAALASGDLSINAAYDVTRMTQENQREVVERIEQGETPEKSDRQIGRELGVAGNTVTAQRKEMERTAQIEQLTTTIGADGKERPRQVERKPAPKPEPIKYTTPQALEPLPVVKYAEPEPVKESPTHVDEPEPPAPVETVEPEPPRKPVSVFNPTRREERAIQNPAEKPPIE